MIEVTIKVADDEQTLTQKFLIHEEGLVLSHDSLALKGMVDETVGRFKGSPTDVLVKIKYQW